MRTRIALVFPLLCAPMAFWACGDDAGNDSNGSESAGCTVSENKDGSYTVSCADGTEAVLHDGEDGNDGTDGKDGSSCTVAVSKDSSTYILICDGKVVGGISDGSDGKDGKDGLDGNDGKNGNDGADGNDGKNGKDGADGTSCTVADTTDAATGRTGYKIICDGERKRVMWVGANGVLSMFYFIRYGDLLVDSRDGHVYKTVTIGTQTWMAENLNYADSIKTPSLKGKSWCYDNNKTKCDEYGRLYTWAAAIDSISLANDAENPQICGYSEMCTLPDVVQGVCPEGWHLPTKSEWETLFVAVGGSVGKMLKSTSGWSGSGNGGMDAYGFSALPAGYWDIDGYFDFAGYGAFFWSASQYENDSFDAYFMRLSSNGDNTDLYSHKSDGLSVRCLQN